MVHNPLVCLASILVLSVLTGCQSAPPVSNVPVTTGEQKTRAATPPADVEQKQISPLPTGAQAKSEKASSKPTPPVYLDFQNNIYFELGKTDIDDRGIGTLAKHAERLKGNAKLRVTLIGHTDNLGSPAYNQAISDARLRAVARILRHHGVAPRQIRRISLGNERKKAENCRTDECRQTMRRVELSYGPAR